MAPVVAPEFRTVDASAPTVDGQHIVVKGTSAAGAEVEVAIAADQVMTLIDLAAEARDRALVNQGASPTLRIIYETAGMEVIPHFVPGFVVLTMRFGAGGTLSFSVPSQSAKELADLLRQTSDGTTGLPPGIRPN